MGEFRGSFLKFGLLIVIWIIWWWTWDLPLSDSVNLAISAAGLLLVFPFVWLARKLLDRNPTTGRAVWVTTLVHYGLGIFMGIPIIRAVSTHLDRPGWVIPVPAEVGLVLVVISGLAFALTVANLALKGLGAPFAIALSEKLAVDWLYAWTRNPMVLAAMALLLSLGVWFQSGLFILWALLLFMPALLFFEKVYEERELEVRFGAAYREYRSKTPMLFPRRPGG